MGGAAANFDIVILFKGDGNRRFQRRAYRRDRHTRLAGVGRRLFRQIRIWIKPPSARFSLQLMQQTIHHVIADEGARGLRRRGRDPCWRSALTIALIGSVLKQAAGPLATIGSSIRLLAFIVGDPRIIDIDRYTFDGDIDTAAGLSDGNRQPRLIGFQRRLQHRQRFAEYAG